MSRPFGKCLTEETPAKNTKPQKPNTKENPNFKLHLIPAFSAFSPLAVLLRSTSHGREDYQTRAPEGRRSPGRYRVHCSRFKRASVLGVRLPSGARRTDHSTSKHKSSKSTVSQS